MAYFEELNSDTQERVVSIISERVYATYPEETKRWKQETIDDWLNCHNWDMSNGEWVKEAETSDDI
jgi:hypothetical protein